MPPWPAIKSGLFWVKTMGIDYHHDTPSHPSIQKRVQSVRSRLSEVAKNVELFRAGGLLFQKGSYHDSEAAFREFAKLYPAREVLNNIGACYLNLALRLLQQKFGPDYYRFKLSTAIDYSTTAETFTTRNDWDYLRDKDIPGYLEKAVNYFKMAAEKDRFDRACRYNLSAVLILKKKFGRAQAVCDTVLERDPQDIHALNNKAIASYYYGKEMELDTTQNAIQMLQKAHRLEPKNAEVLYNLASIKQESNQSAGAKLIWEKYLNLPLSKRDNFYHHIYQKLKSSPPPQLGREVKPPSIPAGLVLGQEIHDIEKRYGKEHTRTFKIASDNIEDNPALLVELKVILINNIRVLAMDGTIEIVEQEFEPVENIEPILEKYGPPQKIVRFNIGSYYVYENSGFSIKEINNKVCAFAWFAGDL
jgi:tetratricopeptide (TPR) repeat protein